MRFRKTINFGRMKNKILKIAIENWNQRFVGTSAIELSEELKIDHKDVLNYLYELKDKGKGSLREGVKLGSIKLIFDEKKNDKKTKIKEVNTVIFFPSKKILTEYFNKKIKPKSDKGEFLNRLHKGYSQIHLFYFVIEVLNKYFNHLERYDIYDDITGGCISMNDEYIRNLPEKEWYKYYFEIRYGKRKLVDNKLTVSVVLKDLADLSKREQKYWEHFEIKNPVFLDSDTEFEKFYLRHFEGEFVNIYDPLSIIQSKIKSINNLFTNKKLFKNEENRNLIYPIENTLRNYCYCNKELYKLIGPDSLNKKLLENLLIDKLNFKKGNLLNKESQRPLSKIQLLKLLIRNKGSKALIGSIWSEIKENRKKDAHEIIKPQISNINYYEKFKENCKQLCMALEILQKELDILV